MLISVKLSSKQCSVADPFHFDGSGSLDPFREITDPETDPAPNPTEFLLIFVELFHDFG